VKPALGKLFRVMAVEALIVFVSPMAALPAQLATPVQVRPIEEGAPNTPGPLPAPVQPIPYSHKTHLALGLTCDGCHTNPNRGVLMAFPATTRCMGCHSKIAAAKPAIQKLADYDKSKTPVPWVRVYTVLPGVKWSHRRHLDAGMKCEMCHGQVSELDVMAGVKSVTSMGGCISCHKVHGASTSCVTCHPAWAPEMQVVK